MLLPADPEDPGSRSSLAAWTGEPLLPQLNSDANSERISLPLGRPMASLHRMQQPSSPEPREVYHYQVRTDGLAKGQKLLLGALSHDSGQPTLLLSYTGANGAFEEAHWALPVECGQEICSYQACRHRSPALAVGHLIPPCTLAPAVPTSSRAPLRCSHCPLASPAAPHSGRGYRFTPAHVVAQRRHRPVCRQVPFHRAFSAAHRHPAQFR